MGYADWLGQKSAESFYWEREDSQDKLIDRILAALLAGFTAAFTAEDITLPAGTSNYQPMAGTSTGFGRSELRSGLRSGRVPAADKRIRRHPCARQPELLITDAGLACAAAEGRSSGAAQEFARGGAGRRNRRKARRRTARAGNSTGRWRMRI